MKLINLYQAEQLKLITDFIAGLEFDDGNITAYGRAKEVKQNQQLTETSKEAKPLLDKIRQNILTDRAVGSYAFPHAVMSLRVARYTLGDGYGWHFDMPHLEGLRTDLSFTVFLNDDFTGGELELDFGHHQFKIKGNAGQMLLYPTGVRHRVCEVTEGERLCVVGWINSLIPRHEDREALFRMSAEMHKLAQASTDTTIMHRLDSVYQHFCRRASN